jgi:hypothetical protein
MYKGVP